MFSIEALKTQAISPLRFKSIRAQTQVVDMMTELVNDDFFQLENAYYKQGLAGSLPQVFIRKNVAELLMSAISKLGLDYKFLIFDAFRSLETQKAIFEVFYARFLRDDGLMPAAALSATQKMVPYPCDEDGRPVVTPHNTGGAVDLTIMYRGEALDMGTDFDDNTKRALPDFFEGDYDPRLGIDRQRWLAIRRNRRLLFNLLIDEGFTGHPLEWWHYDFGNQNWSAALGEAQIFSSAEEAVGGYAKPLSP